VPLQIVDADIDNDRDIDLVLGGFELESDGLTQRSVRIAERTGEMEFSVGFPLKVGWAEPSLLGISVVVTDADGNGWLDILATARSDVEIGVKVRGRIWILRISEFKGDYPFLSHRPVAPSTALYGSGSHLDF
jgi:hypothetical protein